jgi:hypothetical protein
MRPAVAHQILTCTSRSFLTSGHSYFSLSFSSFLNTTLCVTSLSLCNVTLRSEHRLPVVLLRTGWVSATSPKQQGLGTAAGDFDCTTDHELRCWGTQGLGLPSCSLCRPLKPITIITELNTKSGRRKGVKRSNMVTTSTHADRCINVSYIVKIECLLHVNNIRYFDIFICIYWFRYHI